MKVVRIFFLSFACLLFTACPNGTDTHQEENLPDEAIGFALRWNEDGGMLNESRSAYASADSAYWEFNRYGEKTIIRWSPSKDEIQQLYEDVKEHQFNKITTTCEGEVFDRGGYTYYIDIDGDFYEIVNSGHCFVDKEWQDEYVAFQAVSNNYFHQAVSSQAVSVKIKASEELLQAGYDVQIENDYIDFQGRKSFNQDTTIQVLKAYPGMNRFIIRLNYADSSDYYGNPVAFKYDEIFWNVTDSTDDISISWQEEILDFQSN